ncbi:translation initiation factor IF-2-like [Schistocerca serialis cubense]|uniref:translation initiation factor IF-2-like n=1 Tax=Schistocerca serialis cubense TaxID=2023355 RepID=UPI00214E5B6E|nr:translation initiation factor IF-2-like [Schistocerca serialis cubense]
MKNKQTAAEGGGGTRKGTAVGPWRLGEFLGPAASPHIAAAHPKTLTSSKMTQRPSPEAAVAAAAAASAPDSASAERVARYKEERRRQLAAAPTAGPGPPPQRRFISRAASAASATAASASASSGDAQTAAAPRVRTTRTSRLRSAATASTDSSPNAAQVHNNGFLMSDARFAVTSARRPTARRIRRISDTHASRTGGGQSRETSKQIQSAQSDSGPRREKDKSAKRKSNLNRCLTAEAVAPAVHSEINAIVPPTCKARAVADVFPAVLRKRVPVPQLPAKWRAAAAPTAAACGASRAEWAARSMRCRR